MRIVAVCIGPNTRTDTGLLPNVPLVYRQSPKHYFPRGSPERVKFTAEQRNIAMKEMLMKYPECTDVLMIDDYYLDQKSHVQRLINDYSKRDGWVLAGSTWTRDMKRLKFWDYWATPECSLLKFEDARGIQPVSGIGACYLFPRSAWDNGARFDSPDFGTEHLPFHKSHGLPLFMDFDVKLYHPPNIDVHAPFYKKVRKIIGPRNFIPIWKKENIVWYRGFLRHFAATNGMIDYERWVRRFVKFSGRQFVEVGANVGMHAIRACRSFGTVVAFEPEEEANRILRWNARLNNYRNIRIFRCAIMDRDEVMPLNIYQQSTWNSMFRQDEGEKYTGPLGERRILKRQETVQVRKLDDFTLTPTLLWIDVEGAEEHVLRGGEDTIDFAQPEILIEAHSFDLKEKCIKILESHDYETWVPETVLPEYIVARSKNH